MLVCIKGGKLEETPEIIETEIKWFPMESKATETIVRI